MIGAVSSDQNFHPQPFFGQWKHCCEGVAYGKGWSAGRIAGSGATFFLRLMVDQLILTELMFGLLRIGEPFPQSFLRM